MLKINDKIKTTESLCFKEGEEVIIKDIILKPNNEHTRGAFPLLKVELPNGKILTYTHKFFNVDIEDKYKKVV